MKKISFVGSRPLKPHEEHSNMDFLYMRLGVELDKRGYEGIREPYNVSEGEHLRIVVEFDDKKIKEADLISSMKSLVYEPAKNI